ncbi:MAG TPA: hypothetical protein VFV70_15920, partial [Hyphomonadaceae bacterium]|nr:hypothetical protein [Hyphomonadaceae bacterium]
AILNLMKRSAGPLAVALALFLPAAGHAQTAEPTTGAAFSCDNGARMVLSFRDSSQGLSAIVWLQGESYRLAHQPPERGGPPKVVWSDSEHSLTWMPGVRLMWMSASTHLMCGRGDHKH